MVISSWCCRKPLCNLISPNFWPYAKFPMGIKELDENGCWRSSSLTYLAVKTSMNNNRPWVVDFHQGWIKQTFLAKFARIILDIASKFFQEKPDAMPSLNGPVPNPIKLFIGKMMKISPKALNRFQDSFLGKFCHLCQFL